jgi:hypothetical protein
MTQIIDHGKWVPYQPDKLPEYMPAGALFVRRESDGVDWYDYSRDAKNFYADTVKFTVLLQHGHIVGAATRDVTRLFPTEQLVLELTEFHGEDPQAELGVKRYDPDTRTLQDRPKPLPFVDPLEARVAAIEALLGIRP